MNPSASFVVSAMLADPAQLGRLLRTRGGEQPLYSMPLRAMAECRGARPLLVTDLPEAAALARELGIATLSPNRESSSLEDPREGPPYFKLIARSLETYESLADSRTPIAVLDWRWPLLSAVTISRALESFKTLGPPMLASASLTEDNPVQAYRGYRLSDAGMVVFLEDNHQKRPQWLRDFNDEQLRVGNEAPYLVTRPFFLNWAGFSLVDLPEGSITALCWLAYAPEQAYFFISRERLASSYYSQSVVLGYYRYVSTDLAQHLISSYWLDSVYPRKLAGLDPMAGTASPGAICLSQGEDMLLCLPGLEHPSNTVLRVWPFRNGRILEEQALEIPLDGQEERHQFLWNQTIHLAVRLPKGWLDVADGFNYTLMVPDNREADFMEPLLFRDGPYCYDPELRAMTTSEGVRIAGRQHFAPLSTLKTALTVLRFQDLRRGWELFESKDVAAFALPRAEALFVEDEIDLARIG